MTRRSPRHGRLLEIGAIGAISALSGCAAVGPPNPALSLTDKQVDAEWTRLRATPGEIERPVIVLGGRRSPAFTSDGVKHRLIRGTGAPETMFESVSYPFETNIDRAARRAIERVDKRWPSDDPTWTTEVDVVGISMGGLVARTANLETDRAGQPKRRLKIARLYTLATPHRGARLAQKIAPDRAACDMRPGSPFLQRLDTDLPDADYDIIPYAVLNDVFVGATNCAPGDELMYWTQGTTFFSHFNVTTNRAILVDLIRRLRGDPAIFDATGEPPRN